MDFRWETRLYMNASVTGASWESLATHTVLQTNAICFPWLGVHRDHLTIFRGTDAENTSLF